ASTTTLRWFALAARGNSPQGCSCSTLVSRHLRFQPGFHRRPFCLDDAVHDRVADEAIPQHHVLAQDSLTHCAQPLDGGLRLTIAAIGLELHAHRAQVLE